MISIIQHKCETPLRCESNVIPQIVLILKDLLHYEQLCNFLPLWVSRWVLRFPVLLNDLLHFAHFSLHTMPTNCLTSDLNAIHNPGSHLCASNLIYVTLCNSFSHVTQIILEKRPKKRNEEFQNEGGGVKGRFNFKKKSSSLEPRVVPKMVLHKLITWNQLHS